MIVTEIDKEKKDSSQKKDKNFVSENEVKRYMTKVKNEFMNRHYQLY